KSGGRAIAVLADHTTVVSLELPSLNEIWRASPSLQEATGPSLVRLSDDGRDLVVGDQDRVFVLDGEKGDIRGTVSVGSYPTELSFVPQTTGALVVGSTSWTNHLPKTYVVDLDTVTLESKSVGVPNCNAPVVVLPDASRAFLSPTFCQEGQASSNASQWTNP